jgi:Ni/Co efflux regulator RcnB
MFLQWQNLLVTIDNVKKQEQQMAAQQDAAQQEAQAKAEHEEQKHRHAEAKHDRDKEKHSLEVEQIKAQAASDAVQHGNNSLKEVAKQFGATKAGSVGGTKVPNPINHTEE